MGTDSEYIFPVLRTHVHMHTTVWIHTCVVCVFVVTHHTSTHIDRCHFLQTHPVLNLESKSLFPSIFFFFV